MITGASQMDGAILLVDGSQGAQHQTREHVLVGQAGRRAAAGRVREQGRRGRSRAARSGRARGAGAAGGAGLRRRPDRARLGAAGAAGRRRRARERPVVRLHRAAGRGARSPSARSRARLRGAVLDADRGRRDHPGSWHGRDRPRAARRARRRCADRSGRARRRRAPAHGRGERHSVVSPRLSGRRAPATASACSCAASVATRSCVVRS